MLLGDWVEKQLSDADVSQAWLGRRCGKSRQYIGQIVRGEAGATFDMRSKMADAFGCETGSPEWKVLMDAKRGRTEVSS